MKSLAAIVLIGCLIGIAPAADITVLGSWNEVIDASDVQVGSGSNFPDKSTRTTLDVSNTNNGTWRILARRADNSWDPALTLRVRRTSTGSGSGSVAGGEDFITINQADTEIFTGSGDRSSIGIETLLSGLSVTIAPDAYSAGIIFTVVP